MTLVDLASVARRCALDGTGLGAFNVVHIEQAEAFIAAAERAGRPVVLQVSENAVAFHGDLAPLGTGVLAAARAARVPVVVHLDHAKDTALIREAIELGFTSVMYDGSHLPFEENQAITAEMVAHAHAHGVSVEAELGEVGGKDGVHHPAARTVPAEAAQFTATTGVDLLAVAVGSSHAMTTRGAQLDTELITALAAAVPVPLVLHGSSGVSDAGMAAAIVAGITKVNVSTHLNTIFTAAVRELLTDPAVVDTRTWMAAGIEPVGAEVERLLRWYASAGTGAQGTDQHALVTSAAEGSVGA